MRETQDYTKFLDNYKDYAINVLTPYKEEVKIFFSQWLNGSYWNKYSEEGKPNPSPIHRLHARVKRPESVADKIHRKINSTYNDGFDQKSFKKMHDTVGVRIVVFFLSSLTLLNKEILEHPDIEICDEDPPIGYLSEDDAQQLALKPLATEIKESGYHSIHYVLRLKKSNIPLAERPFFELQVRTLTQDVWGEIEHFLGYKPNKKTYFSVKEQFKLIGDHLKAIDKHFNFLNEELNRFQTEIEYDGNDIINAENLPKILSDYGIRCSQREIGGLLKLLFSRGIEVIRDFQAIATPANIELINNTYISEIRRAPISYELVANIANLKGIKKDMRQQRIIDWIEFLEVTKEIRKK